MLSARGQEERVKRAEGKKEGRKGWEGGEGRSKSGVPRCNRRKYGRRVNYARDASNNNFEVAGNGVFIEMYNISGW